MSDHATPDEILKKLRQNVYMSEAKEGKNSLWQFFKSVYQIVGTDKSYLPYVMCARCEKILSYDSAKGGTSHLRRHVDACAAAKQTAGTTSLSSFFKTTSIPKAAKDHITEKCVEFVCRDIRPFNTVEGEGFLDLAQALINVGVRYGQVNAADVLPHRTTVSNNVAKRAAELKESVVIPDILSYLNRWGGGVTTDMWTECQTQTPFITVTVHYITDEWALVARTVATSEFDPHLQHTGVNIKQEFDRILAKVEVNSSRIICVTDRGANMLAAFRGSPHISCCDHMINTVLSHVFDANKTLESLPDVKSLLTSGKDLVRYFKKSGLMSLLSKSLKQDVPTRWNSIHTLLVSLKESYSEVEHILEAKSERYRYV
jgi:hypothetical protein